MSIRVTDTVSTQACGYVDTDDSARARAHEVAHMPPALILSSISPVRAR
jgi:hypothetical protein